MSKLIQFLILAFLSFNICFAQEKVSLNIYDVVHCKNTNEILLYYKITNDGTGSKVFYKPEKDDFCNGLLHINVTNTNLRQTGFYFPCKSKEQLDNILLDNANTFELGSKQYYKSFIRIQTKYLSIVLKKHKSYSFLMSINYNDLESNSTINFYNNKLISNNVTIVW